MFRSNIIVAIFCAVLTAGSIAYRLHKGKPILRPDFSQPRFAESWCSGRSDRSVFARMMGARHFLWVAVTQDALHVSPHIPFNLMFLAEAFGWDHRVPAEGIMDVREFTESADRSGVNIRYLHKTGHEENLVLTVSNVRDLISALHKLRGR